MIAALFVAKNGCYFNLPDVDPWDETRDARKYRGPHPVVAHPPCERWGKYWHGGPNSVKSPRERKVAGADGGCFAAALKAVRRTGGVLEHPSTSKAWDVFGLERPPHTGGWVEADHVGGWTCHVEQGHYGHRARKATWLYAAHVTLPELMWGPSAKQVKMDHGFHSTDERRRAIRPPAGMTPEQRAARRVWLERYAQLTGKEYCTPERMAKKERAATPLEFRDLLLGIARTAA